MDVSTREQWMEIVDRTIEAQPRVARQILDMVRGLSAISDGFSVDQMQHALQTATRAERDGANEEVIVASLLHDVGKLISVPNHPKIAAEILKPYVHYDVYCMVSYHQDFQGRYASRDYATSPSRRPALALTLTTPTSSRTRLWRRSARTKKRETSATS